MNKKIGCLYKEKHFVLFLKQSSPQLVDNCTSGTINISLCVLDSLISNFLFKIEIKSREISTQG
jgi:hypothetical protein